MFYFLVYVLFKVVAIVATGAILWDANLTIEHWAALLSCALVDPALLYVIWYGKKVDEQTKSTPPISASKPPLAKDDGTSPRYMKRGTGKSP